MVRHPLVVVAFSGAVVAIERRTGNVVWTYKHESSHLARMMFPPGRVVLAYGNDLVALDYATGVMMWTNKEVPSSGKTVLIDHDQIFLGSAGQLSCVDANTGAVLWHHPFDGMGDDDPAIGVPGNVAQVDES